MHTSKKTNSRSEHRYGDESCRLSGENEEDPSNKNGDSVLQRSMSTRTVADDASGDPRRSRGDAYNRRQQNYVAPLDAKDGGAARRVLVERRHAHVHEERSGAAKRKRQIFEERQVRHVRENLPELFGQSRLRWCLDGGVRAAKSVF